MVVVDSSGWIEFFTDGPKDNTYKRYWNAMAARMRRQCTGRNAFCHPRASLHQGIPGLPAYGSSSPWRFS